MKRSKCSALPTTGPIGVCEMEQLFFSLFMFLCKAALIDCLQLEGGKKRGWRGGGLFQGGLPL